MMRATAPARAAHGAAMAAAALRRRRARCGAALMCRRRPVALSTTATAPSAAAAAASEACAAAAAVSVVDAPTGQQLRRLFLANAVPFIGFGFADNLIMILAGAGPFASFF